ncbi:hypothetical protein [Paraliomyxa miuraensis]|uniref:hypothetical protein n=1 Tax=Paraliomyxa miuraensis TaxID=376150 RepID=UPI0022550C3B|nr:hypothetical protein [Paraliomyxa miuraensis]MCX4243542.1 hypothetical protein [Paraliomyxa miuraensis]
MERLSIAIMGLALAGCFPSPKDAGEVESTESDGEASGTASGGATADGETQTDGEPSASDVEWTLELDPGFSVLRMIRTPAGVLVALQGDPSVPMASSEVREYSSSMDLLWSAPLPNAGIGDLEDLGGGEFLAVGVSGESGAYVPTAWRLSCCAAAVSQAYPQDPGADFAWAAAAELRGDGILLVIGRNEDGLEVAELVQIPLALSPPTSVDVLPTWVRGAARTPDGNVLLLGDGGDIDMFYEVGPGGVTEGFGFGGDIGMVGKGDELTLVEFGEDEVSLQPYGEEAWVQVPIPGFAGYYDEFVLDRHTRVGLVHREEDPTGPLVLSEFGDDGVVVRTLALPHQQYDYASARAIAVGEDDAIYLAVGESQPGGGRVEFLHRIAPLE